jgi:flagellar hook-basal body protein
MGWDTTIDAKTGQEVIQVGPVTPLNLKGEKQYVPPKATSLVAAVGNLNVNELPSKYDINGVEYKEVTTSMNIYDSEGNNYTVDTKFTYYPYIPNGNNLQDHVKGFWTFEFATVDPTNPASGVLAYPKNDRENPKVLAIHVGADKASFNAETDGESMLEQFSPMGILVYDTNGEMVGWDTLNLVTSMEEVNGVDTVVAARPTLADIQEQINGLGLTYNFNTGRVIPGEPIDGAEPRTLELPDAMQLVIAPKDVVDPTATFGTPLDDIAVQYLGEGQTVGYDEATGGPSPDADLIEGSNYVKAGRITMDLTDLTQWGGQNSKLEITRKDGNEPGTLQDLSIGPDGKLTGRYSNGQTKLLGQIAVATFQNPAGLEKVGSNLFAVTANSGQWAGVGETGEIIAGALEMSNVDLSMEFNEMITTQRGFQANSRIITVSDEMLQELVNLKR